VSFLMNALEVVRKFFVLFRITDIVDIAIVAYIAYKAMNLVKETRAGQLVKGLVVLVALLPLSQWLRLNTINYILRNTMQVGLVALLVVFQPELRRALEKVGRSKWSNIFNPQNDDESELLDEVCDAVSFMSKEKIGALIVFERETKLGDILNSGTELQAKTTSPLLINIFIPNTPLHDGAVVIRDSKIQAAACILPLTHNDSLSRELGTRHRAALGVTENSDCAVVVVSEETGKISFAQDGDMKRGLTVDSLKKMLQKALTKENVHTEEIKKLRGRLKWKKK